MKKITILSLLMTVTLACASIQELVPQLTSDDLSVRTTAQIELLARCSTAGRPGAEDERKAICEEMCALLKKSCPAPAATQLIRNLQRIGGEESVATLVKMLGASDEQLRDDARQALAVNPSPAAGQALQAELGKAKDARWKAGLITALGERGGEESSAVIIPFLDSRDPLLFTAAVKALARLGENDGIRALAMQRAKERDERKALLTAALFETGRQEVYQKLYAETGPEEVRAVALVALVLAGQEALANEAMASGKPGLQCAVIEAAGQRRNEALDTLLAKNLSSLQPHLQVQALGVLEFSANTAYSPAIVPLISSGDANVQIAAAQALGRVGAADAVPALLAWGSDDAKAALGMINAPGVDGMLAKVAKSGDVAQRVAAIEALALRGDAAFMDMFFASVADADQQVAMAGAQAVGMLGRDEDLRKAVAVLLANEKSALSRDLLKSVVSILRRSTNPQDAVAVLVDSMSGATPKGQSMILQVLAQDGSPEALAQVAKATHAEDADLRKEAVKQLGNWSDDIALPVLLEVAGDASAPMADHVVAVRGIVRLLAGQKKLDQDTANKALELCRRDEEKQQIRDLIDASPSGKKKK